MPRLRIAVVVACLLLPSVAQWVSSTRARSRNDVLALELPDRAGEWRASSRQKLDPEVSEMLVPDAYALQLYTAPGRAPIWIYAALYRGTSSVGAHDPEICYPAQGWTISERRNATVEPTPGDGFPAWFMRTELSGNEELVLYWFQPSHRWPRRAALEQFLRAFDRLAGRTEYGFVRLSVRRIPTERRPIDDDRAALEELARTLAPSVLRALSGEAPATAAEDLPAARPRS